MIDWVDAILPYPHADRICGGWLWKIERDGTFKPPMPVKNIQRGSFDTTLVIQSSNRSEGLDYLFVSASPKFLQGHNLFGVDSPVLLAALLARVGLEMMGVKVDPFTFNRWLSGDGVQFFRIDVTYMLDVGSEQNSSLWMDAVAEKSVMKYRGRGEQDKGTVYFGRNSKTWALKLYRKFVEINSRSKRHRLRDDLPMREELLEYARGTVRAELVFHSMELKRLGLNDGRAWRQASTAFNLWSHYLGRLQMNGNVSLRDSQVDSLPRSVRSTYLLWRQNRDVQNILSRATFYRHRSVLLKHGIDIMTRPAGRSSSVVPIIRVLEARPKGVPDFAVGTPLLATA